MRTALNNRNERSRTRWAVAWAVSFALHAWLIFPRFATMSSELSVAVEPPESVEINLIAARQLVDPPPEDPDAIENPDTPYVSENLSRARDFEAGGEDLVRSRSTGEHDVGEVSPSAPEGAPVSGPRYLKPAPEKAQAEGEGPADGERRPPAMMPQAPVPDVPRGRPMSHPDLRISAEDANAAGEGALSLSTYAWQWVPYVRELKERIETNLHPPPAFWQLGIIEGETRLKFRILPDGTLLGPVLLGTSGHESLDRSSMQSVSASAPMRPLPNDFPEEYLDISCRYYYWLPQRRGNRRRPRKDAR